jgi:ribosomal protein L9
VALQLQLDARNFLLPQKKALRATKEDIARFEKNRGQGVKRTSIVSRRKVRF